MEVVGSEANYPILSNFDCSHTLPMISVPELCKARLSAADGAEAQFEFLESGTVLGMTFYI